MCRLSFVRHSIEWPRVREKRKGQFSRRNRIHARPSAGRIRHCWSRGGRARIRHCGSVWRGDKRRRLRFYEICQQSWNRGRGWTGQCRIRVPGRCRVGRQHCTGRGEGRLLGARRQRVEHLVGQARERGWGENAGAYSFTSRQSRSPVIRRRDQRLLTCTHGIDPRPRLRAGQSHRLSTRRPSSRATPGRKPAPAGRFP